MNIKGSSGWTTNRESFSELAQATMRMFIDWRREKVALPENAIRGERFVNDDRILLRLESQFSEKEFLYSPVACLDHTLVDAAKSDYWYHFEKDWGNDCEYVDEEENAD